MIPHPEGRSSVLPPCPVLGEGRSARLDLSLETEELDLSLENLNQLIQDLDPSFEPPQRSPGPGPDETVSVPVLVSRDCRTVSPNMPIPSARGLSCSPHGSLVFSCSPTSALPPRPCGNAIRRSPIPRQDGGAGQSGWRLSQSNRNSTLSLLSTSSCSDTSYILGSSLSLNSEDADPLDFIPLMGPGSGLGPGSGQGPGSGLELGLGPRSGLGSKHARLLDERGVQSSPASLSGSLSDIPLLLVNGAQPEALSCPPSPGPQRSPGSTLRSPSPHGPCCHGNQASLKFVMDRSRLWFRPHLSRAEAEALVAHKEPGTFVIRDSTSYRGSFGLAMKMDQSGTETPPSPYPGKSSSGSVRHFLIESSAKGVRIKGSSQEPYFGSLPALVYQHTVTACALPRLLRLSSEELCDSEENPPTTETKTAGNFVYLNAVPTERLTGPRAVQRAVTLTLEKVPGSFTPTVVNLKVSPKGVTLTDVNRKLFFRRHYPAHLLSFGGEDPDDRRWRRGLDFAAKIFGFVAKGVEVGAENVCHVFAEHQPLQSSHRVVSFIQDAVTAT